MTHVQSDFCNIYIKVTAQHQHLLEWAEVSHSLFDKLGQWAVNTKTPSECYTIQVCLRTYTVTIWWLLSFDSSFCCQLCSFVWLNFKCWFDCLPVVCHICRILYNFTSEHKWKHFFPSKKTTVMQGQREDISVAVKLTHGKL